MADVDKELVIREVTPGVWTFSKPFARFGIVPYGGRSTAIKLESGDVFVFVSTPLTPLTKSKLAELGTVKYLVVPDLVHNMYITEFKKGYPDAKAIGIEGLGEKMKDIKWDGFYGSDPAETKYGFEPEITACYFSGFVNKDVAFFHAPSKTIMVADLLFNLPAKEQYSKSKSSPSTIAAKGLYPYANFHKTFLSLTTKDKAAMTRDATTVASWDFDRIIMCHGDVIETDGKKAWTTAYEKVLN